MFWLINSQHFASLIVLVGAAAKISVKDLDLKTTRERRHFNQPNSVESISNYLPKYFRTNRHFWHVGVKAAL